MIQFILNDKTITTDLSPGMVLLDFIRYRQHLTGTKIGCREGDCGACTVLVGELFQDELRYETMTSCLVPLGNAQGKHIVSIEGINHASALSPVQQAMVDEGGTQCGFCTPGFVLSLTGFCLHDTAANQSSAIAAIDGNICRCTGYKPIERAAGRIAELMKEKEREEIIAFLTKKKIIPDYFLTIQKRLVNIHAAQPQTINPTSKTVVGGGTDLYVQKQEEMMHAEIHFINDEPGLSDIRKDGNQCVMGAAVTITNLKASPLINTWFPEFQRYAKLISSTPIRNMATIAGNFINASPIGDLTIFFLALDAQLVLSDGITNRELPLRKLYKGYKTLGKRPEERIEQIRFDIPGEHTHFHFEKVSKRTHLDIASVNSAICITMNADVIEKAGVSAGGVGPVPMFLEKTAAFLTGNKITEQLIQEAIEVMQTEISPISDARGGKDYKKLLLGQLIKAHFMELFPVLEPQKRK